MGGANSTAGNDPELSSELIQPMQNEFAVANKMQPMRNDSVGHIKEMYGEHVNDPMQSSKLMRNEFVEKAIDNRYNRDVNSVDQESVYSPEVKKDRSRVVSAPFNADSSDYDYLSAESAGYKPSQEEGPNKGHMGSVRKSTPQEIEKYGVPQDSYLLLKGAKHPTHKMAVDSEAQRGFEIVKYGDRYFSVPKQKPVSSWDAINSGL